MSLFLLIKINHKSIFSKNQGKNPWHFGHIYMIKKSWKFQINWVNGFWEIVAAVPEKDNPEKKQFKVIVKKFLRKNIINIHATTPKPKGSYYKIFYYQCSQFPRAINTLLYFLSHRPCFFALHEAYVVIHYTPCRLSFFLCKPLFFTKHTLIETFKCFRLSVFHIIFS